MASKTEPRASISLDSHKRTAPVHWMNVQCFECEGRTILDYIEVQFTPYGRKRRIRPTVGRTEGDVWGFHVELHEMASEKDISELLPVKQRWHRKPVKPARKGA